MCKIYAQFNDYNAERNKIKMAGFDLNQMYVVYIWVHHARQHLYFQFGDSEIYIAVVNALASFAETLVECLGAM